MITKCEFDKIDKDLLSKNGRIIHQVWFGTIPNKKEAAKVFKTLEKYRNTWILLNPDWTYMCWNLQNCESLIKTHYPEYLDLYKSYPYAIQRCDFIRYVFLYRYGGIYADMDYICIKPFDEVLSKYKKDLYLVETPNKTCDDIHVSNSLMYCKKDQVFWKHLLLEMQMNSTCPYYYSRHMTIMFTTGPSILNRVYNKYRYKYNISYFPYKLFHPKGITSEILVTSLPKDIYACHIGKGTWESFDSKVLIFLYSNWKLTLFILLVLFVPNILSNYCYKRTIVSNKE